MIRRPPRSPLFPSPTLFRSLMPLAVARRGRGRSERALAARDATAAAAYLTIVTPSPPRGGAGYDLPQLLIRARALEELPGFSGRFEIYHATAPLVRATAPPLPAATLQRLRREVRSEEHTSELQSRLHLV